MKPSLNGAINLDGSFEEARSNGFVYIYIYQNSDAHQAINNNL